MFSAADKDINVEEVAAVVAQKVHNERRHSRAYHRAARGIRSASSFLSRASATSLSREVTGDQHGSDEIKLSNGERFPEADKCVVQFAADTVSVDDGDRVARLRVKRTGSLANRISVKYETYNGTAEAGTDYMPQKGNLVFGKNEESKLVLLFGLMGHSFFSTTMFNFFCSNFNQVFLNCPQMEPPQVFGSLFVFLTCTPRH